MFGIGLSELVLIFVVLLVVIGPDRLPDVGRAAGKLLREVKNFGKEFRDSSHDE